MQKVESSNLFTRFRETACYWAVFLRVGVGVELLHEELPIQFLIHVTKMAALIVS